MTHDTKKSDWARHISSEYFTNCQAHVHIPLTHPNKTPNPNQTILQDYQMTHDSKKSVQTRHFLFYLNILQILSLSVSMSDVSFAGVQLYSYRAGSSYKLNGCYEEKT